jgi:hypothetical protein
MIMTNNSGFLHEEGTAQTRNGEDNKRSNNEDTREEAKLDLHAGKSKNKCILPKRQRKRPIQRNEDFLWN